MRILLLTIFILTTLSSYSQEWIQVAEGNKRNTIYIDKSSVQSENNYIFTSLRIDYNDDEHRSEYVCRYLDHLKRDTYTDCIPHDIILKWIKFKYTVYNMIYDVKGNKSATVTILNYTYNNKVLSDTDLGEIMKFDEIEPDSLDDTILKELLKYVASGIENDPSYQSSDIPTVGTIETIE